VASAADSRARKRAPLSVAIGQDAVTQKPERTIAEIKASQPSVVLCAKTIDITPESVMTRRASLKDAANLFSKKSLSFGFPSNVLASF
jgi:hypothetical protein